MHLDMCAKSRPFWSDLNLLSVIYVLDRLQTVVHDMCGEFSESELQTVVLSLPLVLSPLTSLPNSKFAYEIESKIADIIIVSPGYLR